MGMGVGRSQRIYIYFVRYYGTAYICIPHSTARSFLLCLLCVTRSVNSCTTAASRRYLPTTPCYILLYKSSVSVCLAIVHFTPRCVHGRSWRRGGEGEEGVKQRVLLKFGLFNLSDFRREIPPPPPPPLAHDGVYHPPDRSPKPKHIVIPSARKHAPMM